MTAAAPRLLLINHFALETVCGTTVMFGEVLRLARTSVPDVRFEYDSYEAYATAGEFRARLDAAYPDVSCVVALNAHIEVYWEFTVTLYEWCRERGIDAYVYAHDYWPHHHDNTRTLTTDLSVRLLAATPFVAQQLTDAGFEPAIVDVGIALPDTWPPLRPAATPKVIASVARLVPRKRLADIVRAFADSGLDGSAALYLRVAPSQVFGGEQDAACLREIEAEIARGALTAVTIDYRSGERPDQDVRSEWYPDYGSYAAYVCSSSYEGFGMPVVEATFYGCPPLMSDIPPHVRTARMLFGERAGDFVYPVGNTSALAALMADEISTGRRKAYLMERGEQIRGLIASRLSLRGTATALAQLARRVSA
jgi:glycosyltransferase involved in cell wall biosynthesis